jgi:DNA-binding transcriptional MerR regulator
MTTRTATHVITAPEAAELAGITYRQLDYWARRGWVAPSIDRGTGRAARRLYSADDVVRLAALGHFGRARADVG